MPPARNPCDAAREALWPNPDALAPVEAREHYEQCPECQGFFARDRELANRLACLPVTCAPDHLRARVAADLTRSRRRGPRVWQVAVGALAAAAALVLFVFTGADDMDRVVAPLAAEARAMETAALAITSADAGAVGGWFAATLGNPLTVPAITDAELVGGRVAVIGGRPAAVVLYRMHGDPLTYFALAEGSMSEHGIPADEIMVTGAAELKVAVWMEGGGVRAVAAAMPRETVMAVATECRNKAAMVGP